MANTTANAFYKAHDIPNPKPEEIDRIEIFETASGKIIRRIEFSAGAPFQDYWNRYFRGQEGYSWRKVT